MMRTLRFLTPLLLVIAGCNAFYDITGQPRPGPGPDPGGGDSGKVGLSQFKSAAEFQEYFTAQVAADHRFGFRTDMEGGGQVLDAEPPMGADAAAPPSQSPGETSEAPPPAGGFSTTTTQEEGVQESDIIKNDGQYIYILSSTFSYLSSSYVAPGSLLRVVQADPGESLGELASLDLEGWGQDLYLLDDKVVALTRPSISVEGPMPLAAQMIAPPMYYQSRVQVNVIDVSDHANPTIVSTTWFEGDLSSSRMIGDVLHLVVVNYPEFFLPMMEFRGDAPVVTDVSVEEILPDYEVSDAGGGSVSGDTVSWPDFYYPIDADGYGMTTVISLNINAPADFRSVGVVGYPGNVYASTQALYLTDAGYDYFGDTRPMTDLYKFAFTDDGPVLAAVGSVPGRILNQYSMSEYADHLRVATTVDATGFSEGEMTSSSNNVYVLASEGAALNIVGRVENLAPGEQIYSARFSGPRGYLVTFQQTDPLFTLDLSDPTNPVVVGELQVPGFSTFIIEMDENHLLTVGRDALTDGGFVIPQAVQLSIFDISDFAHPQLLFPAERIGEPDAWSEALYNPKALTYFAAEDLVALPVEIVNYGWGVVDGSGGGAETPRPSEPDAPDIQIEPEPQTDTLPPPQDFRGLYVYRVTPEAGFEYVGRMSTAMGDDYYYSSFTRGVFMNGNVFAVTDLGVVGAPVTAVEPASWQVTFPLPPLPDSPVDIDTGGGVVSPLPETTPATETEGSAGSAG
ncbi:MAG: beta-propeller domain-containing protein [Planctomycetota bacterium]